MEGSLELTLQIVITVLAGISAQVIAQYLKVPSIVILLIFGIVLGHDVLNLLHPSQLGLGLDVIISLSVAIILFEGGLNLELKDLGRVSGSLRNLVTLGTLITLIGGGAAAHWFAEFPWPIAFLYGALVVVSGPTVVSPLLKQVAVDRRVSTLLEGEGVLIDPVGAILAVVVFQTVLNSDTEILTIGIDVVLRLVIGFIIGGFIGWLLGFILRKGTFIPEELQNLIVLAGIWGLFGLSEVIAPESGLMAVVVAGIVLNATGIPQERFLKRFKGQLTVLCVSVLFVLLAAELSIASIFALGWGSIWTVAALMFLVRPLNVIVCTWNNGMNWRQKAFLAWISPKGIVAASVASLFAIVLTNEGINGGEAIKALVFLTILMTIFIQGLTASKLARWLNITSDEAQGAIIIGCNPLGRLIGRLYQELGESVVLIDTDLEACQKAEADNLKVVQSSGLDPDVLEEAGIACMGTFIALTNNGEVNLVLAQRAHEEFKVPRVLAVLPYSHPENSPQNHHHSLKINQAFLPELPIKTWNNYLDEGKVRLGKTTLKENGLSQQITHVESLVKSGEFLPLLVKRGKTLNVVKSTEKWLVEDEIFYIFYDPTPKILKRLGGGIQTCVLALEKLSEIEEIPVTETKAEQLLEQVNN